MRREILIDRACGEVRVALLENDQLAELVIERPGRHVLSGNIYKGRVSTILPGMQSAFLNIGLDRDAFLYVQDLDPPPPRDAPAGTPGGSAAEEGVAGAEPAARRIEDRLRVGEELLVQVVRDPFDQKGARITAKISLPGRYLVYLPQVPHFGVSRRIEDPAERERLRSAAAALARDAGLSGGVIARTAASGASADALAADARALARQWSAVLEQAARVSTPGLVRAEAGAMARTLRDVMRDDVVAVTVEDAELHREALEVVRAADPALADRIHVHGAPRSLFDERGIPVQIDRALRPRVWLKSGGSIVINQTEALVAIDVNTGKYVGTSSLEETILKTNLEAVGEIVRQVRLRDLGGIIVIDFIDMEEAGSKGEVIRALEEEIRNDRAKSRMLTLSEFGLVEITRQRSRPSLERTLSSACPECGGSGRIKSSETLFYEIVRAVRSAGRARSAVTIAVHPARRDELEAIATARSVGSEASTGPGLSFRADPDLAIHEFRMEPLPGNPG